jgi:hypothetical protein
MKKINLLLAACAVLLLVGCNQSRPNGASQASSSSSSGAALRIYRNEKYGFTLKIPTSWRVDEESRNRQFTGSDILFEVGSPGVFDGITIDDAKTMTIRKLISRFDKKIIRNTSDMTVGDEPGTRVDTIAINTTDSGPTYVYVIHDNRMYRFKTNGKMLEDGVIASMRFLEGSSSSAAKRGR